MADKRDKLVYQGRLIALSLDTVHLPNGKRIELEVVRHPGGAVIVALDDKERVCLLKQHRYAVRREGLWEVPAGCIDATDAEPLDTAKRELEEEAGLQADQWTPLGSILTSPGFCDEILHLYLARGLRHVGSQQQEDEIIEIHWVNLDRAVAMAAGGEIVDAKSVAALFRTDRMLR